MAPNTPNNVIVTSKENAPAFREIFASAAPEVATEQPPMHAVQGGVDAAIGKVKEQSDADRERALIQAFIERTLTWHQYAGLSKAMQKTYRKNAKRGERRWPESPMERTTRLSLTAKGNRRKKAARQARRVNRA
jgi:hypothetical protein